MKNIVIFIIFLLASIFTVTAYADNYENAKKLHEMSREVEEYQKSKIDGRIDYSINPTWDSAVRGIIAFSCFGISGLALFYWVKDMGAAKRKRLLQIFSTVVGAVITIIGFVLLSQHMREQRQDQLKITEEKLRRDRLEAYKNVRDEASGPIKIAFNGGNSSFLAGDKNYSRIAAIPNADIPDSYAASYYLVTCHSMKNCVSNIFPITHPLSAKLWSTTFYFCQDKSGEKLLTGFAIEYNRYHDPELLPAALLYLQSNHIVREPFWSTGNKKSATYLVSGSSDSDIHTVTNGRGISVIWHYSDLKGAPIAKDMCGNKGTNQRLY